MADQKGECRHFVADGWRRAYVATEPMVRAEVEAQYAEQLKEASPLRRLWLRRKMEQEIQRRIDDLAPPDALY